VSVEGVVGFSDIVGFTEFTAEQGDERALRVLDTNQSITSQNLGPKDRIVKELGDGLLLWFEDPCAALAAAVAMQDDLAKAAAESGAPLWVRIGLHWGCPTERGDDLIGHDVNLASRVSDQAGPGEILITEALANRVGQIEGVEISPLGPIEMKGIPTPVWLYRVSCC